MRTLAALAGISLLAPAAVSQAVSIHYDSSGIPHVFGDTDEAAFFGLGWHHMMEYPIGTLNSLWQTSGRMAEIAGASYLDEDREMLLWELPSIAARHETEMGPGGSDTFRLIEAYVAGVEAGRAWWHEGDPMRIDALLGPALRINADPVPDYLKQSFSPFGAFDEAETLTEIRNVASRFFEPSLVVTTDHVLQLGAAVNSFFLLRSNRIKFKALSNQTQVVESRLAPYHQPNAPLASNGWMISALASGGNVQTLADGHVPLNVLAFRPYLIQVWGDEYRATGITIPGYPALYVGFNDHLSWIVTALASKAVASNKWRVTLLDSQPLGFRFDTGGTGTGQFDPPDGGDHLTKVPSGSLGGHQNPRTKSAEETVLLEEETDTLTYYIPATSDSTGTEVFQRYYVPVHADEPDLGFARYPLIRETDPESGDTVVFEQAAFTVEGSPWEFFYLMGMADDTTDDGTTTMEDVETALATSLAIFGNGLNLQVADADGNFLYQYMGRYPEQGPGVAVEDYRQGVRLDGAHIDNRWIGIHSNSDLPRIGPVATSGLAEVWISNNATPDLVEFGPNSIEGDSDDRLTTADLAGFPEYIVSHTTISTRRQERANDLLRLRSALDPVDPTTNQTIARDQTDPWMLEMWRFFEILRGDVDMDGTVDPDEVQFAALDTLAFERPNIYARVQDFMNWVEEYRDHDETDNPNSDYDFVAHAYSQVTVYGTLLRSFYQTTLKRRQRDPDSPLLTDLQAAFGVDPRHPLFDLPAGFTGSAYGPNAEIMVDTLVRTSGIWVRGSGFKGFRNPQEIGARFPDMGTLPGIGWEDSRFFTEVEDAWQGIIDSSNASTRMIRWGHVNSIVLTPHFIRPIKRQTLARVIMKTFGSGTRFQVTSADFAQGYLFSAIDPPAFSGSSLPFPYLEVPYQNTQTVRALPIGGVEDSLFTVKNKRIFDDPYPKGYAQAIYFWSTPSSQRPDFLYFTPHTSGSQTMIAVELTPSGASAHFLIPYGGTEITRDLTFDRMVGGDLSYQDRFAPLQDFVDGNWGVLETDVSMLPTARYSLSYP